MYCVLVKCTIRNSFLNLNDTNIFLSSLFEIDIRFCNFHTNLVLQTITNLMVEL